MVAPDLDGEIREGRHHMAVRVYYEDTDFTGIVYHASYLRFMERGRTNYLRLIGADQRAPFEATEKEAPGFAFVVRSMTIEFLKPAHMDDVLAITTEAEEVKGASMILLQKVMRADDVLVEAHVRVAFVSGGRHGTRASASKATSNGPTVLWAVPVGDTTASRTGQQPAERRPDCVAVADAPIFPERLAGNPVLNDPA